MSNSEKSINKKFPEEVSGNGKKRKQYIKPQLKILGDLRTLTLGISGGINESGPFTPNHW